MSGIPQGMTVAEMKESGAPVSALRKWYDHVKSGGGAMARAKLHAAAAGQGIRMGGESLIVGGALGALHCYKGLDQQKIPVDAAIGVLGLLAGAGFAHEEFGADLRNAGATGLAIFSFRKTFAFCAQKKGSPPVGQFAGDDEGFVPHGESSDFGAEDPIVAAAKFL